MKYKQILFNRSSRMFKKIKKTIFKNQDLDKGNEELIVSKKF